MTPAARPVRVLHFVTGGFSGGATQVALQLVNAARDSAGIEPLLVLRHKRRTPPERIAELQREGVSLRVVPGWSNAITRSSPSSAFSRAAISPAALLVKVMARMLSGSTPNSSIR